MAQDEMPSDHKDTASPGPSAQHRGTFLPLIFGGAVAAALGFFGSQIESVERALGLAPPDNALEQRVDEQAERIAEQQNQIAALTEALQTLPEPPSAPDLSGLEGQMADQSARLNDLETRLEAVEKRPMTDSVSKEAIAAYDKELQRMQTAVAEQRAEIEALVAEARDSESEAQRKANAAQARAVATRIVTALDNGQSFSDELAQLSAAMSADVPEILAETADDGVVTLAQLQARFPAVSRAALSAARREEAASGQGGLGAFLERQLGARSVTPQEGDDPDAVLSRAEAAVLQGRLGEALAEIDALPDAAREEMHGWISQAETRHDAVRAAQALLTALATN